MGRPSNKLSKQLILKYVKKDSAGCWIWQSDLRGRPGYRYGTLTINYRSHRVTKLVLHLWKGLPLNSRLLGLHTCDVPACVNPRHLFSGTIKDNIRDAINKNRWQPKRGVQHHNVKLNETAVLYIRKTKLAGYLLARKYKVSKATVTNIRKRDTWRHL